MRNPDRIAAAALCCAVLATLPAQDPVQSPSDAGATSRRDLGDLLPDSTVAILDIVDGVALVENLEQLVGRVPVGVELRALLATAPALSRLATGLDLVDLAAAVAPSQALLALVRDGARAEPVYLARVGDGSGDLGFLLRRLRGRAAAEVVDGVLRVARDPAVLQRAFGDGAGQLGAREGFHELRPVLAAGAGVRLYVDIARLRAGADGRGLWSGLDGGGRWVIGPIAAAIDAATRFDAVLTLTGSGLALAGALDASVLAEQPAARLVAGGRDGYAVPPAPDGTLLRLTLDRSLRGLFGGLDALLGEDEAVEALSFLSIADRLVQASFVDDLLAGLGEPLTAFVVGAPAGDAQAAPVVDLPAVVVVARLDAPRAEVLLTRMFRALAQISFFERAQQGRLPFQLRQDRGDPERATWYAEPVEWRGLEPAPIEACLTPTLTFAAGHAVIATTREAARRMVEALGRAPLGRAVGDVAELEAKPIADYLARNRRVLALNAVLDDGVGLREAENRLRWIDRVLHAIARASVRIAPDRDRTSLRVEVELEVSR